MSFCMLTTRKAQYNFGNSPEMEQNLAFDSTPVSSLKEGKARLLVMALGVGLSIASPKDSHAVVSKPHGSIACVLELTREAYEATTPSSEWETTMSLAHKAVKFPVSNLDGGGDKLDTKALSALGNLAQASDSFFGGYGFQELPAYAQDLLYQVWEEDLSDEPLIAGMK
jgi:hypothetical protein